MFNFFITTFFLSFSIFAQEGLQVVELANKALGEVKEINGIPFSKKPCDNFSSLNSVGSCIEITDNFCSELWNDKNKGNAKVFDGEIKAGKSEKSDISLISLEDDKALIDGLSQMPEDTQPRLKSLAEELKNVLQNESDDPKWFRKRSEVKWNIDNAIEDIVDARFEKHHPDIKVKNSKDWTVDQHLLYSKEYRGVKDELTTAKYKNNPNWARVEKVFPQIRDNLIKEVDQLKLPDARKKIMREKLAAIKLTLPLRDPDSAGSDDECSTTTNNAYYTSLTNQFTVCAGLFNRYQSDSAIAFVISHELGHSIDSENLAKDDWRSNSPVAGALSKLTHSKGPVYKCDEWENLKKNVLKPSSTFKLVNVNPLEKLYTCFRGSLKLEALNKVSVSGIAKAITRGSISENATYNNFSSIAQKLIKKNNNKTQNEMFLRPDKLLESQNGYNDTNQTRDVDNVEIFTQNLSCAISQAHLTEDQYETASEEVRSKIFASAIDQTAQIAQIEKEDYFRYCGKNCSELASYGVASNPQETNADWFATLAFPEFLKNIPPQNRAEASALTTSLFCNSPDESTASPELTLTEKKYSLETHPDDRARRTSLYTPEVANLINCQTNTSDKGNALCKE